MSASMMKWARWWVSSLVLLQAGGCYTSGQLRDFAGSEVARLISNLFGQVVLLFAQATSPVATM